MSTKIYEGVRLPYTNLAELYGFALAVADRLHEARVDLRLRDMARSAAKLIDRAALGRPLPDDEAYGEAPASFICRQEDKRRMNVRDPDWITDPYEFSLLLYPRPRWTLALLFTRQRDLREMWYATPGVEHWGYWDSTDRPDGVGPEEWREREEEWEAALRLDRPEGGVPVDTALMLRPSLLRLPPESQQLVDHQPPFDHRVMDFAQDRLWDRFIAGTEITSGNIGRKVREFDAWRAENPEAVRAEALDVRSLLKERLAREDFLRPLPKRPDGDH